MFGMVVGMMFVVSVFFLILLGFDVGECIFGSVGGGVVVVVFGMGMGVLLMLGLD